MAAKPPLELHAIIRKADGRTFRWDANDRHAANRPMGIECSSKLMEGFADAGCELARRPGVYPDLGIYDDFILEGLDGQVAYEGRGDAFPGDVSDDTQRVGVNAVGWMTHGRDRPMPPTIYVDRDLSRWTGPASYARQAAFQPSGGIYYKFNDGSVEALPDDGTNGAVKLAFTRLANDATNRGRAEAWYHNRGAEIGSVYYDYRDADNAGAALVAAWVAELLVSTDDTGATNNTTGDIAGAASSGTLSASGAAKKFAALVLYVATSATADGEWKSFWRDLAVFGPQGLTKYGTAPSQGYLISDMISDSGRRYAPLLDYSQVAASDFVAQQAITDEITDPYDFWLDLNRWEMRHLAVWEDRKLTYEPFDYDDVDWRVRTDEPGVRVRHAGPSAARVANGVIVSYQDVSTMRSTIITPDDDDRLADTDPNIAANQHGIDAWEKIQLPDPDSEEGAIRYGQKALEQLNRQQAPTRITVKGHIRDDADHWHQGWMPRAGQTVLPENEEDAAPRMIHEARWNAAAKTLTLSCDASTDSIDAILDQLLTQAKMARSR